MKKYKCEYENGENLNIQNWQKVISAIGPQEAYDKFIALVGTQQEKILVFEPNLKQGGFFDPDVFEGHIEQKDGVEVEKNKNLSTDELLAKIIQIQKQQSELFENQIKKQNEQTEALYKIRWAIIALLIFIVGQTIVLKMKLGL